MRTGIHPAYVECKVTCSCGSTFTTRSTESDLHIELCSQCHPFYTGKQKFVDTGGRVQRFSDKFGGAAETVMAQDAAKKEARQKAHGESEAKLRELRAVKDAAEAERARNAPKAPVVEEVVEPVEAVDATPDAVADEAPAEQDAAE